MCYDTYISGCIFRLRYDCRPGRGIGGGNTVGIVVLATTPCCFISLGSPQLHMGHLGQRWEESILELDSLVSLVHVATMYAATQLDTVVTLIYMLLDIRLYR